MTVLATNKPQPGTEVDATALASNFAAIEAVVNGNIDEGNMLTGPVYSPSKLKQGGAVTGDVLKWDGAAWIPGSGKALINTGTVFPTDPAPVGGDLFILLDSGTAPTYAWLFRYSGSIADAYKWVFLGGSPMAAEVDALTSFATNAAAAYSALGPTQITVPRPGIYDVEIGATYDHAGNDEGILSFGIAGAVPVDTDGAFVSGYGSTNETNYRALRRTFAAATTLLELKYKQTFSNGAVNVTRKRISARPVRLS